MPRTKGTGMKRNKQLDKAVTISFKTTFSMGNFLKDLQNTSDWLRDAIKLKKYFQNLYGIGKKNLRTAYNSLNQLYARSKEEDQDLFDIIFKALNAIDDRIHFLI